METPKLDQNSNNHSQTTSMLDMQNKLQEVISPSSSKPEDEDDYYMENEVEDMYALHDAMSKSDDVSTSSIPMAHKEYEKILR